MVNKIKKEAKEFVKLHYLSFDGNMPLETVFEFIDKAYKAGQEARKDKDE